MIDPGWKNLGVILVEFDDIKKKFRKRLGVLDLGLSKNELDIMKYYKAFKASFELFFSGPVIHFDYFVFEQQPAIFKQNRKMSDLLQMFFFTEFFVDKVFPLSPIVVKSKLGLECHAGNHGQNKTDMMNLIRTKTDLVLSGNYNDHVADCVGILNVFLMTHNRVKDKFSIYEEV